MEGWRAVKHSLLHGIVSEFVVPLTLVSALFGLIAFWPFSG